MTGRYARRVIGAFILPWYLSFSVCFLIFSPAQRQACGRQRSHEPRHPKTQCASATKLAVDARTSWTRQNEGGLHENRHRSDRIPARSFDGIATTTESSERRHQARSNCSPRTGIVGVAPPGIRTGNPCGLPEGKGFGDQFGNAEELSPTCRSNENQAATKKSRCGPRRTPGARACTFARTASNHATGTSVGNEHARRKPTSRYATLATAGL